MSRFGDAGPRRVRDDRDRPHRGKRDFGGQDVIGSVEVGGAGATVDRGANRLLDVVGDAVGAIEGMSVLGVGAGHFNLVVFLKGAHAVLIDG